MEIVLPLDYSAIERILPHRYPFLLVDRITAFEPDKRIVGIKNVTLNERYLAHRVGELPVLPPIRRPIRRGICRRRSSKSRTAVTCRPRSNSVVSSSCSAALDCSAAPLVSDGMP